MCVKPGHASCWQHALPAVSPHHAPAPPLRHSPTASPPHPPHPRSQVHTALSPQLGGSAFASLEEVVARLARAKVGAEGLTEARARLTGAHRRTCAACSDGTSGLHCAVSLTRRWRSLLVCVCPRRARATPLPARACWSTQSSCWARCAPPAAALLCCAVLRCAAAGQRKVPAGPGVPLPLPLRGAARCCAALRCCSWHAALQSPSTTKRTC